MSLGPGPLQALCSNQHPEFPDTPRYCRLLTTLNAFVGNFKYGSVAGVARLIAGVARLIAGVARPLSGVAGLVAGLKGLVAGGRWLYVYIFPLIEFE